MMDKKHFAIFLLISAALLLAWYFFLRPFEAKQKARLAEQMKQAQELEREKEKQAVQEKEKAPRPPAKTDQEPEKPTHTEQEQPEKPDGEPPEQPTEEPAEQAAEKAEIRPARPIRSGLVLANDLISSTWTNAGAGLVSAELLKYNAPYKIDGKRPTLRILRRLQDGVHSMELLSITVYPQGEAAAEPVTHDLENAVYRVADEGKDEQDRRLAFEYETSDHVLVRKVVRLPEGRYHFGVRFEFENKGDKPVRVSYRLRTAAGIEPESLPPGHQVEAVVGVREDEDEEEYDIVHKAIRKLDEPFRNESRGQVWAGVHNRYFAAVALAQEPLTIDSTVSAMLEDKALIDREAPWAQARGKKIEWNKPKVVQQLRRSNAEAVIKSVKLPRSGSPPLEPGQSVTSDYLFVLAPKSDQILSGYKADLEELQQFTFFRSISRLLMGLLKWLHKVVPNYGLDILLLTLLVKLALHPLSRKSQISMARMQQLQPEMVKLREKFGDDKTRLNAEMMALYQRYGVNPMSGCLPILIQMPVFLALFGALRASIELRQAAFLWIDDLSQPDVVMELPFTLLNIGSLNVLPLLFLVSSMVSQHLQPKAVDEKMQQQQKMMKYMSIMFAFILYNMPAGLLLYWTTSNILGIFEQWRIRKHVAKIKAKPLPTRETKSGGTPAGGKSAKAGKAQKQRSKGKSGGLLDTLNRMLDEQQKEADRVKPGSGKKSQSRKDGKRR